MKFNSQVTAGLFSLGLLAAASAEDAVKFNIPGATPAAPAPKQTPPATTPAPKQTPPIGTPAPKAAAPAPAAPLTPPAAAPAAPAPIKFSEDQLMEAYGYIFVMQTRIAGQLEALEITPAQKAAIVRGIAQALNGEALPYNAEQGQQLQTQLQDFMGKRQDAFLSKLKAQQTAAATEYFAKLKENKNVIELPSGLRYEIVKAGTGPVPKPGQVVTIHYILSLATGQPLESTRQRGQPAELMLQPATPQNPQGVIAGMFEGLQKTGVGGQLKLHIPAALAYGDEGNSGIPPGAALIFEVEIVAAKDAPPAPAAPAAK